MAIVDALLVTVGDESYAIAVSSVRQIVEISADSIHRVGAGEFLQTGEQVLPLLRLARALEACSPSVPGPPPGRAPEVRKEFAADSPDFPGFVADGRLGAGLSRRNGKQTMVIIDSGQGEVGLVVDRVLGQQEIVVKALSRRFEDIVEVSGGSILGDGSVCLILDAASLLARANKSLARAAEQTSEVGT